MSSMVQNRLIKTIFRLLTESERRRALILGVYLVIGTILEVVSLGALVPLMQVLTQSNLQTKYPSINRFFPNSSDQYIVAVILAAVIFIFILKEIFLGFSLWMQRGFIARFESRIQTELFNRYTCQPYEFHLMNNSSILSRNILNYSNFVNNVLDPIFMLLTDGFVTVALCVALIVIEPIAMFITISSVGAVAIAFHSFSKRRIERWGVERQYQDGIKIQQMNETFGAIKEIMVTGRSDHFQNMFSSNVRQLSHLNRKFTTLLGVPRLYLELLSVTGLAALVLSMLALGRNSESLLPLLALFAGGAFRLMPAVNRITFAFQSLRMGRPIISVLEEDISHVTLEKTELEHKRNLLFENMIRVENVSYSYQNHLGNVIEGVNLEIKKGSEVGIIGTTGAGKSTFLDILLGLLKPTIGKVTVDGVDISTDIRGWQNLIGYVPQTVFLIDTSIKANIAFGIREDEIDNAKVTRALELAQLNEFVDGLPNGVDELVGERGVRLSGGQRQRIAIARALYLDPPILVFDEATSALDIDTEKEVMKSISHLKTFKTIVIVTHRLSALDECDQLVKIENRSLSIL